MQPVYIRRPADGHHVLLIASESIHDCVLVPFSIVILNISGGTYIA